MAHVLTHEHIHHQHRTGVTVLAVIGNAMWYVFAVGEALLLFRLLLRFVGASVANDLISFIYTTSWSLVAPFSGILGSLSAGRGIIEWDTMLAMAVYWTMASVLVSLLRPRYVVADDAVILDDGHHDAIGRSGYQRGYAD